LAMIATAQQSSDMAALSGLLLQADPLGSDRATDGEKCLDRAYQAARQPLLISALA
jgi:hypothetical protein